MVTDIPAETWVAVLAQVVIIAGLLVRVDRRITRIEQDVRWLTSYAQQRRLDHHADHIP